MSNFPPNQHLTDLHSAMVWDKDNEASLRVVVQNEDGQQNPVYLTDANGNPITSINQLPVTLGSNSITITGDVNVGTTVNVASTPSDPVHVHLTEVGTSGILNSPWLPVNGNIWVNGGEVKITSIPEVEIKNDSGNPISVSKDSNPNSTTNRLYVSMETDAVVADSNYFFNVARGLVDSQFLEFKNGYCGSMSSSVTGLTIWNEGTLYPWSSWTTAQTLYIVSDSAGDNNTKKILINGLDTNYAPQGEEITLNGLTAVTTVHQYSRINNMIMIQGAVNVGTIKTHIGSAVGTVVGSMPPAMGRNKQAVFTVPAGHTAYILYGDVSSYKNGTGNVSGQVDMRVSMGGSGPFLNAFIGVAANGQYRSDFPVPFVIPEKSDIDVRFAASGQGTTVACSWEMILIPN